VNQQVTEVKDHLTIAETERAADLLAWQVRVRQTYGYLPSQVPLAISVTFGHRSSMLTIAFDWHGMTSYYCSIGESDRQTTPLRLQQ